jgi:Family of unknown function (DUF5681)
MTDDEAPPDDGYEVGYGRPPKHSQFKPGRSGNPKGRPHKSKNVDTLIKSELDATVTIKEGGRELRITKREAIVKQFVNSALKGDPRKLLLMLKYLEKQQEPDPYVPTASDDAELLKLLGGAIGDKGEEDEQR